MFHPRKNNLDGPKDAWGDALPPAYPSNPESLRPRVKLKRRRFVAGF